MKKKNEKKFAIISTEWSKAAVSIVEANLTQQIVILRFNENCDLSNYAICSCRLSPLLGTPENILDFYFDFPPLLIHENEQVYAVFNDKDAENSKDEDGNILVFRKPSHAFELNGGEAVGLLKHAEDGETWKLVDWANPIIDERLTPGELQELKQQMTSVFSKDFYKREKSPQSSNVSTSVPAKSTVMFERPLFWLYIFLVTMSIFEIASLINFNDESMILTGKSLIILLKNLFTGLFIFYFIRSHFKFLPAIMIFFVLCLLGQITGYLLFSTNAFVSTALLFIIISIYSYLTRSAK